ncbi:MAG: acyl-ACP--UDP-N-acetylglucosamine O-acyltransferase [Kiritimatiellae bacterium]|nr:acyl-ACP--UDP-N-acetylglucosamine O-acyltransferase [Kiritimatiellia bacterium]
MSTNIHPTAIVDPAAQLGADVTIGPYAIVEADTIIGDGSLLEAHAVVKRFVTLGPRCHLHTSAVIGDLPQDLSFTGEPSYVVVGADTTFREFVTVHRGTVPGTTTSIGSHVFMMACSHAAHNTQLGDYVIVANAALLAGYVTVGEHAFIGGGTPIHQHSRVGRYAMVAGGSAFSKDIPPYCITAAVPPNHIAGLNLVGLRRNGFTPEQRKQIRAAFGILYLEHLNSTDARATLAAQTDNPYALEFAEFMAGSTRGLCPPLHLETASDA